MKKASSMDELRDKATLNTLQVRRQVVTTSIQKAINTVECAAKEKHVRNAILGTHQDKGAELFWRIVMKLPLSTQSIIAWKFCYVLHKILRDGHSNVLKDSIKYRQQLKDLGKNWGQSPNSYGRVIGSYLSCLTQRMDFHKKYHEFPGNLSITDEVIEKIGHNDINAYFELCVDLLDCIDALVNLQRKIFSSLDMSKAISVTGSGQCRLSPCIPIILDSSQLYDYTVKIMFKLHTCLPADTLSGHRQRFQECYLKLKKFYYICSNLQYFKTLIQVPLMPDNPPDFLLKPDKSHKLGPVRVIPEEAAEIDPSSPGPEMAVDFLGSSDFNEMFSEMDEKFSFNGTSDPPQSDSKDAEIELLKEEISRLKFEIDIMQTENLQETHDLHDKIKILEEELMKTRSIAKDSADELAKLRRRVNMAEEQAEEVVKVQTTLHDVEKRAHGSEELYKKLKERHLALVNDHADLLRKNADTKRVAETLHQSAGDSEQERDRLRVEVEDLKRQLEASTAAEMESDRKYREERSKLIVAATEEACDMIEKAAQFLDDDVSGSKTCSAESLMQIVLQTTLSLQNLEIQIEHYNETEEIDGLVKSLSSFGHWMAETIENGGATCNMAPDDQGTALEKACRNCGRETLSFLNDFKRNKQSASSNDIKHGLEEILSSAKELLPKISDIKGGDLHDLVEQEMASTTRAVEQAAERIETLLNEARQRDTGVNLEVNERILDSCTELVKTIQVLIMSAKELQREIVTLGRGASSSQEFYMKNSRWTEGLISAAKAVGWSATMLTDSADLVMQGDGKFEELMVWSHEISASTAQLVAASRVKAAKGSEKLIQLQGASRNVNGATAKVVASTNAGRRQLEDANESIADLANIVTLTQIKRKEMDSQVRVLELEQALQQERVRLGDLRKKHYELAGVKAEDDNEEGSEVLHAEPNFGESNSSEATKPVVAQKPVRSKPTPVDVS